MKKIIVAGLLSIIIVVIGLIVVMSQQEEDGVPPVLNSSFIDLDKVEKISKFRSCQGHTVVPQDESESMRNMKHYVVLKPEYSGGKKAEIRAPFDGFITGFWSNPKAGLEGEIAVGKKGSNWSVSFEHLIVADGLKEGQKIKEGKLLGYAADKGVDVVYSAGGGEIKVIHGYASPFGALDSIFNHMSDEAFIAYQKKGISNKDDLIYSREFRDKNPCRYLDDNSGQLNDFEHPEDWVFLK